ncbi:hypothetical protein BJ912DRAFT_933217 [Pholiota molesta]|nr:hypothetical protein BJ912DRAFT_933217 [Pholiota molesta]
MGRVAKHTTAEECEHARKEKKKVYSQTKEAKALRQEQNKRAYQKRTQEKSKLSPTWPSIPRALRDQAALPIPQKSHFFLLEYRSREEVSDQDPLAKWDYYPPYHVPHGTIAGGGLEAIVDRVHGRRHLEQRQHEAQRLQRYNKGTDDQILAEIGRDINTYLTSWNELRNILKTMPYSDIDHTMGEHLKHWKARRVVDLLQDWKVVKKGRANGAFECHYANRW